MQSLLITYTTLASSLVAAPPDTIFDESLVPEYTLPDPLVMNDGSKVAADKDWMEKRRPEILHLFEEHVHGRSPEAPDRIAFKVFATESEALGGKALMKQVTVYPTGNTEGPRMDLLLLVPNDAKRPVPTFLGLNFFGNHSIHPDPAIKLSDRWMRPVGDKGIVGNRATEASRGASASRWAVEMILDRGYALATVYYGDIEPDFPDGWKLGLRAALASKDGAGPYGPNHWGSIGVWAWGLSRALDYLELDEDIDAKRVAVMGHSRLGKTALWAGAQDERFAAVISNDSGEGGASIVRRRFGEALHHSVSMVPYWYREKYREYAKNESALPVDAHMLVSLSAPRPVYVASAEKDLWADPKGEFLAAKHAGLVYRLFGYKGVGVAEMPSLNQSVGDRVGYHVRTGDHDVTDFDWEQYLNFADRHFRPAQ